MKRGDLIRVRYLEGHDDINDPLWSEPVTGMFLGANIHNEDDLRNQAVYRFWCIEKQRLSWFMPNVDSVEVIYEVNDGD